MERQPRKDCKLYRREFNPFLQNTQYKHYCSEICINMMRLHMAVKIKKAGGRPLMYEEPYEETVEDKNVAIS